MPNQRGFTVILFLILIAVLSGGIIGGSFYIKSKNPSLINKQVDQMINDKNIENSDHSGNQSTKGAILVAFVKNENETSRRLQMYDLTNQKFIDLDPNLTNENDSEPNIGEWSPDGRYLPIHYMGSPEKPRPLYFYDIQSNKAIKLLSTTRGTPFDSFSFPELGGFWISDNQLTGEGGTIDSEGKITSKSYKTPTSMVIWLGKFQANQSIDPAKPLQITNVVYNNRSLPIRLEGQHVVGIIKDMLVSLEVPIAPGLQAIQSRPDVQNAIENAKTDQEVADITKQFLTPRGDTYLRLYSLSDGKLLNTITIKDEGWITKEAQIRPFKNTVVVEQQDDALIVPFNVKYIEIDPETESQKTLFQDKGNVSTFSDFQLTSDGKWLVFNRPSQLKDSVGNIKNVYVAWSFEDGNMMILCQPDCSSLQVYNPQKIYRNPII